MNTQNINFLFVQNLTVNNFSWKSKILANIHVRMLNTVQYCDMFMILRLPWQCPLLERRSIESDCWICGYIDCLWESVNQSIFRGKTHFNFAFISKTQFSRSKIKTGYWRNCSSPCKTTVINIKTHCLELVSSLRRLVPSSGSEPPSSSRMTCWGESGLGTTRAGNGCIPPVLRALWGDLMGEPWGLVHWGVMWLSDTCTGDIS